MAVLAFFYLIGLAAIVQFYPEAFFVPSSFAESSFSPSGSGPFNLKKLPKFDGLKTDGIKKKPVAKINDFAKPATKEKKKAGNIAPRHKFSEPKKGAALKGKKKIIGSIPEAGKVEYYAVKKGSLTENYLGKASQERANEWKLEIDTKNIPNGEYKLFPKIENPFGKYTGEEIAIDVKNTERASEDEDGSLLKTFRESLSDKKKNNQEREKEKNEIRQKIREKIADPGKTIAGILSKKIDKDLDGISDENEKTIGTDSNSADSDKDGYLDGDEVKNGYDPLKSARSDSDKIVFESPKVEGEVKPDLVKVESAKSKSKKSKKVESDKPLPEGEKGIEITGKGLPNSFVTLYIYSDTPTIVTVMTDENGNWSYSMDKDIEDGRHEVYVAVTDNDGHITAKSEPFFFVKTAEAVTEIATGNSSGKDAAAIQSPVAASRSRQVAVIGIVILISLLTAIACIGLYLFYNYYHKREPAIRKDYLKGK